MGARNLQYLLFAIHCHIADWALVYDMSIIELENLVITVDAFISK